MNNQGWKRMLTGLCVLALLLTGCLPALASTGDKTLQRTVYRDGMSSDYIVSVQVISDGIYLLLQSGQDLKIRRYANAAAAPEEFIIPGMNIIILKRKISAA